MQKQYIFLTLITIMLLLIYNTGQTMYYDYKESKQIENIQAKIDQSEELFLTLKKDFKQKNTLAYKNMIQKSERNMKNPGEDVIYLIEKDKFDNYTSGKALQDLEKKAKPLTKEEKLLQTMSIYDKWKYLLFERNSKTNDIV